MFLKYKTKVESQLDRKIKRIRSDRGGILFTSRNFVKRMALYMKIMLPILPNIMV